MVFDCHVHPIFIKDDIKSCEKEVEKLLDCMKRVGIDKANMIPVVVSNNDEWLFPGKGHIIFSAEFLTETIKKHPGRFFSLLWINPYLDLDFLKELVKKYILNGCINGIKLLTEMNASDERLEPLAGFLEEHDIPILFHCWYKTVGKVGFESNPSEIAYLARRHPKLRITMAHLRGCRYRGVQDIKKLPNVAVDTCGSESEDGYMEYALRELGPDRILFGSDYPGRDFATQKARIDSLELKPEMKEKIFYRNAVKFFGRQ